MNQNLSQCMMWFETCTYTSLGYIPSDRCLMCSIITVAFGSILDFAGCFGTMIYVIPDNSC